MYTVLSLHRLVRLATLFKKKKKGEFDDGERRRRRDSSEYMYT